MYATLAMQNRHYIYRSPSARLFFGVSKLPNPDISKADRVVVVLQFQRQFGWGLPVGLMLTIGQTEDGDVVLDQHAVMQHRESGGADGFPAVSNSGPWKIMS